ncbi:spore coat U domain-containing protein [Acidovorax sp. SUPP3434]|uniref:Csu type fimbrial protein n=1 Tax=Acidovorax sp. SUPP3434 TaxID=2920880 RepID=UPI0023DE1EBA|nr:spore coat U domain-containing protein [Acidovorax sp. SUPP3434]GKT01864.1 spore coat U domain-containing protein [Acidovorax sp. SUPP3434]
MTASGRRSSPLAGVARAVRPLLALAALGAGAPAFAAVCSYAETGASLGTASSFAVRDGSLTTPGSFSITCGSGLLSLLSTDSVLRATLTSDNGFLLRNISDSTKAIGYQAGNGSGLIYSSGLLVINATGANILTLLPNRKATVPVQIATLNANVPAGTYRDTLRLAWTYNLCDGAGLLATCLGTVYAGTATRTVTVELQVNNDCLITPGAINFGSAALPTGFGEAASQVAMVCTTGMVYTVGLGPGSNPSGGRRQMANGSNRLAYDIFFGAGTTPWGTTVGSRVSSSQATSGPAGGIANGTGSHVFPYRARVYPDQAAPVEGTYLDNVVVDVQF